MDITVIGTGYVGTVTGACLSYLGHHVICVDSDVSKIEKLQRGEPPIYEPHLKTMLDHAPKRGGIEFTTDLEHAVAQSDVIFIAVGTPSLPNGEASLEYLEAAARGIGAAMDGARFRVVVNKSTVPVGSGNLVEALVQDGIRAAHAGHRDHSYPFRGGKQPRVSAGRQRGIGLALSGPDCGGRCRWSYACGDAGGLPSAYGADL